MGTDDSLQQRKDEVVQKMSEMDFEARRKEQQASEALRTARLSRDVNSPLWDLAKTLPVESFASPVWDQHLDVMREWLSVATNDSLSFPTMVSTFSAVTAAVANTCATTMYTVSSESKAVGVRIDAIETAEARLGEVIRRAEVLPRVHQSMARLGLDGPSSAGIRSPMDLLDEAHKALTLGEGQAASVLLPMRGCIDRCLDMLIKRRSERQGKVRTKKIEALGASCGRTALSTEFFVSLQKVYVDLHDLLSAKDRDLPRERIIALFNQGLTFLEALLSSIDEALLKPKI